MLGGTTAGLGMGRVANSYSDSGESTGVTKVTRGDGL